MTEGHQQSSADSDQALVVLVDEFSRALLAKLRLAHANGRRGWEKNDWEHDCQQGLLRHVEKGDPRDVAAFCAFMWHHDWITVPAARTGDVAQAVEVTDEIKQLRAAVEYWRLAAERREARREGTGLDIPEAQTLDAPDPQCSAESDLADWSSLPRDLYVTSVKSDGIVFDVTCCSVPMAIGPEVRYVLNEPQGAVTEALLDALQGLIVAYGATDGRNGNSGECWDKARKAVVLALTRPNRESGK